jgi:hypothetical protein
MATANPYWGAPRIHVELLKLGMEISERTVFPSDSQVQEATFPDLEGFLE